METVKNKTLCPHASTWTYCLEAALWRVNAFACVVDVAVRTVRGETCRNHQFVHVRRR